MIAFAKVFFEDRPNGKPIDAKPTQELFEETCQDCHTRQTYAVHELTIFEGPLGPHFRPHPAFQ